MEQLNLRHSSHLPFPLFATAPVPDDEPDPKDHPDTDPDDQPDFPDPKDQPDTNQQK